MEKTLLDYLPEFVTELTEQLKADQKRWGNTWMQRPREGQELRVKARYDDYFAQFVNAGVPVPWMKVVGEALIAWVRERLARNAGKASMKRSKLI